MRVYSWSQDEVRLPGSPYNKYRLLHLGRVVYERLLSPFTDEEAQQRIGEFLNPQPRTPVKPFKSKPGPKPK